MLFLQLPRALDGVLLVLPLGLEPLRLFTQVRQLLFELLETLSRAAVGFLAQRLPLDLQLHGAAGDLVELRRHRVDLHAQLRRRLVHQVDGLVRQESVGDVAVRQHCRGHERRVLELHAVVDLVPLTQAPQDADGVFNGRLIDQHRLEAALESGILLDVLPVLVERGRADRVQLAASEHRLQHVRRVDRTLGGTGADNRMELVDEEDDLALGVGDLLQNGLQALLELAAIFRARDEGAHVEADDPLVLQPFGHVAAHDAAGQALDDRRLANAGLADQHGIVLRAPGQHLDHAADLVVSPDHRVELASLGECGQIAPVSLECLVFPFRVLIGDALRSADARERLEELVARDAARCRAASRRGSVRSRRRSR